MPEEEALDRCIERCEKAGYTLIHADDTDVSELIEELESKDYYVYSEPADAIDDFDSLDEDRVRYWLEGRGYVVGKAL